MNNKPLLLACLLGLTTLSGCKRANEQPAQANSNPSQHLAETASVPEAEEASAPVEQDYGYEGYEQTEPEQYNPDGGANTGFDYAEEKLDVSKYSEPNQFISGAISTYVVITALSDDIHIQKVRVNRGNCQIDFQKANPYLKYGYEFKVYVMSSCRPEQIREVWIETERDTYTFNF